MKTYPDYDFYTDGYFARVETYIRKKDTKDGLWKLIPVVQRWEGAVNTEKILKQFHTECYKIGLFYKFNDSLINPLRPWMRFYEVDKDQRNEKARMRLIRIPSMITIL